MRCGNFGFPYSETEWPDDYLIEIPPKETETVLVLCPMDLEEGETYEISVEYVFTEDARPTRRRGGIKAETRAFEFPRPPR